MEKYADEERVGLLLEHGNDGSTGTKTPTSFAASATRRPVKQSFAWRGLLVRKPRLYLRLVSNTWSWVALEICYSRSSPAYADASPVPSRCASETY